MERAAHRKYKGDPGSRRWRGKKQGKLLAQGYAPFFFEKERPITVEQMQQLSPITSDKRVWLPKWVGDLYRTGATPEELIEATKDERIKRVLYARVFISRRVRAPDQYAYSLIGKATRRLRAEPDFLDAIWAAYLMGGDAGDRLLRQLVDETVHWEEPRGPAPGIDKP